MKEDGYITKDEEKRALSKLEEITFTSPKLAINAPHFVFFVKDQVEKEYGAKLIERNKNQNDTFYRSTANN